MRAHAVAIGAVSAPLEGGPGLTPSLGALEALSDIWDRHGVQLRHLASRLHNGWALAPMVGAALMASLQASGAASLTASAEAAPGGCRVDPSAGAEGQDAQTGGDVAARVLRGRGVVAVLTRARMAAFLLSHASLWPSTD